VVLLYQSVIMISIGDIMSDSNFDKMLGKLRQFKEELEKAKVNVSKMGTPVKPGKTATNEYVKKYDESRQSGANQEPPMTQEEKTKKAEFLAMSKHGQWSLGKTERIGQDNSKAKTGKAKSMSLTPEKESPHNAPKGEPYVGSGKDRMGKAEDEPHKDDPKHEEKEKKIADDIKGKAKKFLGMHHGKEEPHKDDPHHEAKEKKAAKDIKGKAQDIKDLHKMDDATTMQGPVGSYDAIKMDEGSAPSGDYNATGIEKKDLPKDAEYQKHKKEVKDRA
jgi:hypothetical protein